MDIKETLFYKQRSVIFDKVTFSVRRRLYDVFGRSLQGQPFVTVSNFSLQTEDFVFSETWQAAFLATREGKKQESIYSCYNLSNKRK